MKPIRNLARPGQPTLSRLCLSVAGLGAVIESDEPDLDIEPQGAIRRFLVDAVEPDLTVRTRWATLPPRHTDTPVFDSGAVWRLRRAGDQFLFDCHSPIFGPIPYKTASVNNTFTRSEVLLHRPYFTDRPAVYPLEYPLDELLFIHLLSQGRGVELHACPVVDRSGATYLFAGQSGAGKSTMARLWHREAGVTLLSDDRVVVREVDGRLLAYGTPWHGDEPFAAPGPAPLAGIFFLRHGTPHRLTALSAAEAAARLFACSFVPLYDARALEFTLALLETVVRRVPCRELQFAPEASVIDFVRRSF